MDFTIPREITDYLAVLDDFIEKEIKPLQAQDDNERFFDHRREHARTDWDNDGLPRHEWEELLGEMRRLLGGSCGTGLYVDPHTIDRGPLSERAPEQRSQRPRPDATEGSSEILPLTFRLPNPLLEHKI